MSLLGDGVGYPVGRVSRVIPFIFISRLLNTTIKLPSLSWSSEVNRIDRTFYTDTLKSIHKTKTFWVTTKSISNCQGAFSVNCLKFLGTVVVSGQNRWGKWTNLLFMTKVYYHHTKYNIRNSISNCISLNQMTYKYIYIYIACIWNNDTCIRTEL